MGDSVLLPQIRNLRTVADYRKKQLRLKNALRTGVTVDNEANTSAKIAAEQIKQNILPIMPNQDLLEASLEDKTKQFNTAFNHLKSIMTGNDAQTVLRERFGDLEQLQEFNRHWAGFQKFVSGVSLTQPRYFYQYWDRYLKILEATDNTGQFMPLQRTDVEDLFFGGPGGVAGRPSGSSGPSQGGPGGNGGDGGGDDGYGDGEGGSFPGTPGSSAYGTPAGSAPGTPQQRFFPPTESAPNTPRRGWYDEYEPGYAPGDPETKYSEPPNANNESSTPEANFRPSANPGFTTSQRYAAEAAARALERRRQLQRMIVRRAFSNLRNAEYPKEDEIRPAEAVPVYAQVVPEETTSKKKVDDEKRRQDELKAAEEQRKKEAAEKKAAEEQRKKEAAEKKAAEAERKKKEEEEVREAFRKAEAQRKKEDEERQRTSKKLQAAEKLSRIGRKLDKQKGFNAFDKNADYSKGTELAIESFQELQREISDYFLRKKLRYNLYKRPVDYVTGEDIDVQRKYMITKARKIFNGRVFYDTEKNRWVELGKDEDSYKVGLTAQAKKPYLIDGVNQVFNDIQAVEQTDNEERARRAAEKIQEILRKKEAEEERKKTEQARRAQEEQLRKAREAYEQEKKRQEEAGKKITKAAKSKLARMKQKVEKLERERQKEAQERTQMQMEDVNRSKRRIRPVPGNVQDDFEEAMNAPAQAPTPATARPRSAKSPGIQKPASKSKESSKKGKPKPKRSATVRMDVEQQEAPAPMDVEGQEPATAMEVDFNDETPIRVLRSYLNENYGEVPKVRQVLDKRSTNGKTHFAHKKVVYLRLIEELQGKPDRYPVKRGDRKQTQFYNPSTGKGVRKNIRFGAGISAPDEPRYDRFGCYLIHMPSLSKNRLNIKFPSLASHPKIPQRIISSELTALLQKILETGQMNAPLYAALSASDKEFFDNLAHMCKIGGKLGIVRKEDNADMQRFQVVRGEILSGNDAPQLIKELKHLTLKLVTEGKIPKRSAHDLLIEISLL